MKQIFTLSFLLFLNFFLPAQSLNSTKPTEEKKITTKTPQKNITVNSDKDYLTKSSSRTKPDKNINFNGQWKGGFTDNSMGFIGYGGNKIDYVLEIECKGETVSGYSYTYFNEGAKRFYTICKLSGTLNRTTKEITVSEVERTKYNTPPEFRNCFQTHKLSFSRNDENEEVLEGTWIPAPNQTGDCGYGKTLLTRRTIKTSPLLKAKSNTDIAKKGKPFQDMNRAPKNPVVIKSKPEQNKKNITVKPPVNTQKEIAKKDNDLKEQTSVAAPELDNQDKIQNKVIQPKFNFEKRSKTLLKTIEIEQDSFKVDLYDNGEIDGDSVSVFYNDKLLVSHKRLSDKPISLNLSFNQTDDLNELTMYAENLGSIPPNTALMVITDGNKRYEVRITSDTEKNGTVGFIHKKD